MKRQFWNWVRNEDGIRTLTIDGVIAEESWFDDDVTPKLFREQLNAGSGDVVIWVNSPGGDCVAASQIYTMLMEYKGRVTVKIDGIAASAASVIAMAGTEVLMAPTSLLMIHNPLTVAITDDIHDPKFSALCLFAILESFVQEHNNYSQGKEQEKFTAFIVSFQRSWPFLESTDPITLYYHLEYLDKSAIKNVNIGTLRKGLIYETNTMQESVFAEQVFKSLEKFDSKKRNKLLEQHRYVDLLYRLRCRLSHELESPFAISDKDVEKRNFEPYYQSKYKIEVQNDNVVVYDTWELHYSLCFIRALIYECTHNYIEDCIGKGRDPFLNLEHHRVCDLTWYYK